MSATGIRRTVRNTLAAALLAATAISGVAALTPAADAQVIPAAPVAGLPGSFADLVERVSPAVVTITAAHGGGPQRRVIELPPGAVPRVLPDGPPGVPPGLEDFLRRFGVPPGAVPRGGPDGGRPGVEQALGSGFVIDPAGYVVTNRHVIDEADDLTVSFHDGKELKAELVGTDPKTDLALLKVKSDTPLPALRFGNSDRLRVGDWVVAVGNPFGLGGTVTAGIVSARGRDLNAGPYDDFIQIDAPINRGNSGGPTFNASGEVIGINTAIFSPNGGSVGIGFAIPSNLAAPIVESLKTNGRVERGWLGVSLQGLTPEIADSLGLKSDKGALIALVNADSPAAKAGLEPGDVVLKAANTEVTSTRDLARIVGNTGKGKELPLTVWRDGSERKITVAVGLQPDEETFVAKVDTADEPVHGLSLAALDEGWRRRLDLPDSAKGVVVADTADGVTRIRPGDLIESVNNQPVESPDQAAKLLRSASEDGRKNALLLVRRGGNAGFVALPLSGS